MNCLVQKWRPSKVFIMHIKYCRGLRPNRYLGSDFLLTNLTFFFLFPRKNISPIFLQIFSVENCQKKEEILSKKSQSWNILSFSVVWWHRVAISGAEKWSQLLSSDKRSLNSSLGSCPAHQSLAFCHKEHPLAAGRGTQGLNGVSGVNEGWSLGIVSSLLFSA